MLQITKQATVEGEFWGPVTDNPMVMKNPNAVNTIPGMAKNLNLDCCRHFIARKQINVNNVNIGNVKNPNLAMVETLEVSTDVTAKIAASPTNTAINTAVTSNASRDGRWVAPIKALASLSLDFAGDTGRRDIGGGTVISQWQCLHVAFCPAAFASAWFRLPQ